MKQASCGLNGMPRSGCVDYKATYSKLKTNIDVIVSTNARGPAKGRSKTNDFVLHQNNFTCVVNVDLASYFLFQTANSKNSLET